MQVRPASSFVKTLWDCHRHSLLSDGVGEYAPEDCPSDYVVYDIRQRDRHGSQAIREDIFCGVEGLAGD
jgi:hypothetical protein